MPITLTQQKKITQYNQNSTVLIVSSYPSKGGESAVQNAVANYTRELAQSMTKQTPVVIVCEKLPGQETIYIEKNVLVIRAYTKGSLRMPREIAHAIALLPKVETLMVQFEFNIFGTPLSTTTFIPLLFWLRRKGKKITFVFHQVVDNLNELSEHLGLSAQFSIKTFLLSTGMRLFYRAVGWVSDSVVVHTEQLRSKLCRYISDHKISIIPHGVSTPVQNISRKSARHLLHFSQNDTVILVFGYINWYKGSDWIIATLGSLAAERPDLHLKLVLAGGPSATLKHRDHYQKFLQKICGLQHKYAQIVQITGYVPDNIKAAYFQAADLVVLPYRVSMSESGPLSHAFAYGKPFMVSEARYSSLVSPDVQHALYTYDIDTETITFKLNKKNFSSKLTALLDDAKALMQLKNCAAAIGEKRSWPEISTLYIRALHKGYARTAKKLEEQEMKLPGLSVFFPLFNEEANVESLVIQTEKILPKITKKYEIILINDGSTDHTAQMCKKLAKKYASVRVIHQENRGYGGALKRGFYEARYEWIFFSDGDLQFDLQELVQFIPFTPLHDLILGYRINRADGIKRKLFAQLLKVWNKVFLSFPLKIKDIDCAFKLLNRRVIATVESLECDGAMISTELLIKAYQKGISFTQIGVTHYKRAAGNPTGSNISVIRKAILETIQLRQSLKNQNYPKTLKFGVPAVQ